MHPLLVAGWRATLRALLVAVPVVGTVVAPLVFVTRLPAQAPG